MKLLFYGVTWPDMGGLSMLQFGIRALFSNNEPILAEQVD
jgi:hypothetical protein